MNFQIICPFCNVALPENELNCPKCMAEWDNGIRLANKNWIPDIAYSKEVKISFDAENDMLFIRYLNGAVGLQGGINTPCVEYCDAYTDVDSNKLIGFDILNYQELCKQVFHHNSGLFEDFVFQTSFKDIIFNDEIKCNLVQFLELQELIVYLPYFIYKNSDILNV